MEYAKRCIKFDLPDNSTVDLLPETISAMMEWIQNDSRDPESCGFLLGYKNKKTNNITLSGITTPQKSDYRARTFCKLKDRIHFEKLRIYAKTSDYYMGVWHTHPQEIPKPSFVDWADWNEVLEKDSTASPYAFFVIVGLKEFKVWVGDFKSKEISEIFESKRSDGVYEKGVKTYEN